MLDIFPVVFNFFLFACREEEEGQPQRSKKELIALAKEIAAASKEVSTYSARIAKDCPDKRVAQVSRIYKYHKSLIITTCNEM